MSRMRPRGPFRNRALTGLVTTLDGSGTHCAACGFGARFAASCAAVRACDHVLVSRTNNDPYDVLVIGAGPAGASAAYWLAQRGRRVLAVEKKRFPREKTCGDGLTPRAVRQLHDLGLAERLEGSQRFDGLRSIGHGVTLELAWPDHPDFPSYGYVVRRRELDEMVAEQAVKAGATIRQGAEAVAPLVDGGLLAGAMVRDTESNDVAPVRARYVIVADGANSRF